MATYHHIYTNNPTAGKTDGTIVSENRLFTSPISVTLNASQNEEKIIKCAIRCEEGYKAGDGGGQLLLGHFNGSSYETGGTGTDKFALAMDLSTPGSRTYTLSDNPVSGKYTKLGDVELTSGTDFSIGENATVTAINMADAVNRKSKLYSASCANTAITLTELHPGGGATPGEAPTKDKSNSTTGVITLTSGQPTMSSPVDEGTMKANGNWGNQLIFTAIDALNTIFWLKVKSSSDEAPAKDDTVSLLTSFIITAV